MSGGLGPVEGRGGGPAFVHLVDDAGGAAGVLFGFGTPGSEARGAAEAEWDAGRSIWVCESGVCCWHLGLRSWSPGSAHSYRFCALEDRRAACLLFWGRRQVLVDICPRLKVRRLVEDSFEVLVLKQALDDLVDI